MPNDSPPEQRPTSILHCRHCGRVQDCPAADALRYVTAGWPWCCGDVMDFYPPSKPAAPPPG